MSWVNCVSESETRWSPGRPASRPKRAPVVLLLGILVACGSPAGLAQADNGEREVLYYRNPMNPAITSPVPAKDEMGMDYIPVYAGAAGESGVVQIDPAVVQNLGMRTEPVLRGPLAREIDAVGYVGYDERRVAHVHLRAEGWIEDLRVHFIGERVEAGAELFSVYSPALANAQEELLQASQVGQSQLVDASRERLRLLGVDAQQIRELERTGRADPRVTVRAPQAGVVTALDIRHGMYVVPQTTLLSLADLSRVWLLVDVVERQADWVEVGQIAELRLPHRPDQVYRGRVEFVYPSLDAETRTLRARLTFDNPDEELKPNMYLNARILAEATDEQLSIPQQALIRTGRADRVIVALGEGRFRAQDVVPGIESGARVGIREGLTEGDRVVVSGQFLIDSEASVQASSQRFQGTTPAAADPAETDRDKVRDDPHVEQPPAQEADPHAGHQADQQAQHDTDPPAGQDASSAPISGQGTVTGVMAGHRMLTIDHAPIEALDWPAMEMDFTLTDEAEWPAVQIGDRIHFTLVEDPQGEYRIDAVHVME